MDWERLRLEMVLSVGVVRAQLVYKAPGLDETLWE